MNLLRQKRIVQTFYLFLILFIPIIGQLINVQIHHGAEYARKALEQRSVKVVLEDIPRGDILDRYLQPLTGTTLEDRIIVFPSLMENPQQAAQLLSGILQVPVREIIDYFANGSSILPYQITAGQARLIKNENLKGVVVQAVYYRYHDQPLAAHLTGHLGKISSPEMLQKLSAQSTKEYQLDDLVGKMGLEQYYEHELKATQPERLVRAFTDATGTMLVGMGLQLEMNKIDPGRQHLITTIDAHIQRIVENAMDRYVKRGAVVVMDVHTGDIVAMASRPNFNPADISGSQVADTFINHCTALYQPGSTFKLVVAAAALEEGLITPNSTFVCLGEKDELVQCWHGVGHGLINFDEAFAQSCNPVFAELALKLGSDKLIAYARKLGLENQLIIGYPSPIDQRQDWNLIARPYNLVNSSIGQWPVMVSPVQTTAMMNVIANDGVYLPPRVVRELRKSDGSITKRYLPGNSYRAISRQTAEQLQHLLALAVQEGVGKKAQLPVGSAGKTGSAEVAGQQGVNAWFTGYSPIDKPRYVITVLVEQAVSGGESAAPVYKEIMANILTLCSVD